MNRQMVLFAAGATLMAGSFGCDNSAEGTEQQRSALRFTMKSLGGEEIDLKRYSGKVVMIVNVASKCGYTPQYSQLQGLHEKYSDRGLAILGFPCNQFLGQEPGSAEEIRQFCRVNYGVEFDMFSKVDVNGPDACELYRLLTSLDTTPKGPGKIDWNFEKFVLDRQGFVAARFGSSTKPDAPEVIAILERELSKEPSEVNTVSEEPDEPVDLDLADFRWKNRIVLVFAESREDKHYLALREAWDRNKSQVAERDLVLIEVVSEGESRLDNRTLTASSVRRLRNRFQVDRDEATFILIGKDGLEKLRQAELQLDALVERIDAMPMRKREMQQSR